MKSGHTSWDYHGTIGLSNKVFIKCIAIYGWSNGAMEIGVRVKSGHNGAMNEVKLPHGYGLVGQRASGPMDLIVRGG